MLKFLLNHIAISVKDVAISVSFYKNIFHFKEIPNTASDSKTRWLVFEDGRQLHLISRTNSKIKTNKAIHFALSTNDLKSFINHLENQKIEYSDWKNTATKKYIRKDGIQQIYFQDPDGYWIEVNNAL